MAVAGEAKMCKWMHEHQVDWIHKAPALAGMGLNFFFLIRIMWVSWWKLGGITPRLRFTNFFINKSNFPELFVLIQKWNKPNRQGTDIS